MWASHLCARLTLVCLDESERQIFATISDSLRSQNVVIRVNDMLLYGVSQQSSKRESLTQIISADNCARQTLPQNTPLFHMELASYYYLNPVTFPGARGKVCA